MRERLRGYYGELSDSFRACSGIPAHLVSAKGIAFAHLLMMAYGFVDINRGGICGDAITRIGFVSILRQRRPLQ